MYNLMNLDHRYMLAINRELPVWLMLFGNTVIPALFLCFYTEWFCVLVVLRDTCSVVKYGAEIWLCRGVSLSVYPILLPWVLLSFVVVSIQIKMVWMCVLYVRFGSKVRPRTFNCVAMGGAMLFILRFRLLLYSEWSGMNKMHVVVSGLLE